MAGRPKGQKAKVTRQKVKFDPFGFDKVMKDFMAKPKEEKKLDEKKVKDTSNYKGRKKGSKNKPKPPRKIVMPTGRAMDDAITKIQQQLLIKKDKLKKSNGGTMNKQSQLGARLMHTIDRINRDKSLSKPQKREILKKGLKGIRKIRNMNMGGVMRGRGGTFKGVY